LREETASFTKVKVWARKYLPNDNELRDTILSEERETLPRWEALVKLDDYSRMLDSKAKRIAETE
jgi:hypothetical protein